MLAATAVAAALAAFTPVVVHDASERSPLAAAVAPIRVTLLPGAALRASGPGGRGGMWLQYWLFYALPGPGPRDRPHRAPRGRLGARPVPGLDARAARSRRSTRSIPAPSAAGSGRFRCATGGRSCSPPTAPTRPTCKRAPATGCGPTPTTRPTAAAWSSARGWSRSPRLSPAWMRFASPVGRLARGVGWIPPEQTSPLGPGFQPDRWDAGGFAASAGSCRASCNEVGECDGRETALSVAARLRGCWLLGALALPDPDPHPRRVAEVVRVRVVAPDPGADQERRAAARAQEAVAWCAKRAPLRARARARTSRHLAALEGLQVDDLARARQRQALAGARRS